MENIGDWFYIVILIIAAISSLFGVKGKKRQQQPELEEQPSIDETVTKRAPVRKKRTEMVKPAYQTLEDGDAYSSAMKRTDADSIDTMLYEEPAAVFTLEDTPEDHDAWRKALIYSEILKQKY
ncbi:MAG: hypothetical protein LBD53_03790 [Tannerella sp.]|jgi:hypothetical protein|nr:hypothetical protein [Tannerella sp.]